MSQPPLDTPENWDAASRGYAESVAPLLMAPFADEFIDALEVNSESKVLEVACGSGAMTTTLSRRAGEVLATDFAPKMLEQLRMRLAEAGCSNVTCKEQDGTHLSLTDDSFDAALCCFGLMLFPDRHKGFSELCRVVKPKGRVVVTGWSTPDKFEGFGLFVRGMQKAFPDLPPPDSPPPVFSLAHLPTFRTEMENAGFVDVETREVVREMELSGFDQFWALLTSGAPPVRLLLDRVGVNGKMKLQEVLREIIADDFGTGPIGLSNTATMGVGRVPVR